MVPIDPIRNANLNQVYGQRGTGKAQTGAANTSKANPYQTTGEPAATDTHTDGVTISKPVSYTHLTLPTSDLV